MARRQRNNITKLPADIRLHICKLLDDGAEYDEIRADIEVAAACVEKEVKIHNSTILAYRASVEFDEYCKRRREWNNDLQRNRMAALFARTEGGTDDLVDLAEFKSMQICLAKLDAEEEGIDPKDLQKINSALASYQRNRTAQEKEDAKRDHAEKEAELQAKIAELYTTVGRLTDELNGSGRKGLSEDALEEIENAAGLL